MTLFFHYSLYGFANVYLVGNDETGEAIIVDPAAFTTGLLSFIEDKGYDVRAVLLTHNHLHHVKGLRTLLKIYDAEVFSSNAIVEEAPCRVVHNGETFEACGILVQALSVPGHSADSMVYRMGKLLFTGDTLHAGLIGRTASKYGRGLLKDQLSQKVFSLSDDSIVLPGHGPPSSVGAERLFNVGYRNTEREEREERYEFFV